jgi:threonine aldolase
MLQDGAWLRHARHANVMARRLETALRQIPRIEIAFPVESNGVFARIPPNIVEGLHQRGWEFYTGVVTPNESRLMCSWDTTPEDVDAFADDVRQLALP